MRTVVIIPAYNEEKSIGLVLDHIPVEFRVRVIVVDNGSSDQTGAVARSKGAVVVREERRGYGSACLAGIASAEKENPDLYIFLDADYSDSPEDMTDLVSELESRGLDLVVGSRTAGRAEPGALLPQARFGNWLATYLMFLRYRYRFSDLGPFRVIRSEALKQIRMCDTNFGWTIEMQVKALRYGLRVGEVSVRYRKRIGVSKITGTLKGTVMAGFMILWTLARYSIGESKSEKGSCCSL